ncbi:LysR family transcriptional regulator [Hydrogenophaga sp. BPS33]|uniref:LysR family transcriptional regulator n=1 Tax=Hydrogenophaga sp. BPS33 TaxID=2651974 RepID=UPI00131F62BB|nr:LysR family transcriptional regulator [Hydrogenophaga sp. BPS33]QHE87537.1 LysR family transcriptional regulator [Hydrogenophaga sp. BPS33]
MSRPTLLHLETALSVAHIGSFSGAARKLDATQPAISARVRELEAVLGYRLFTRRGQRMELTTKGRQLLEQVEPLFFRLQEILNEREAPVPASIRVGCGQIAMSAWLGKVIGRMQSANTQLRFHISIGISTVLIPLLDQDKLDIAVTAGKIDYPGLHTERLGRRSMGIWVTTPDRWERYAPYPRSTEPPRLDDLINCGPVWTPPLTSRLYTEQSDILREHGGHMRNVNTCDDSRVLGDMIQNSSGLGYAQHVLIKERLASGVLVEVPGLPVIGDSDYYFVWREAHLSPIVHMLMKLAKTESEQSAM